MGRNQGLKNRDSVVFKSWSTQNVWPFISIINQALKRFAQSQKRVQFFDPVDIFVEESRKGIYIKENYMMDQLHPSSTGYRALARAMKERVSILVKRIEPVN